MENVYYQWKVHSLAFIFWRLSLSYCPNYSPLLNGASGWPLESRLGLSRPPASPACLSYYRPVWAFVGEGTRYLCPTQSSWNFRKICSRQTCLFGGCSFGSHPPCWSWISSNLPFAHQDFVFWGAAVHPSISPCEVWELSPWSFATTYILGFWSY